MRVYVDVKEELHDSIKEIATEEKKHIGLVYDEALELRIKKYEAKK